MWRGRHAKEKATASPEKHSARMKKAKDSLNGTRHVEGRHVRDTAVSPWKHGARIKNGLRRGCSSVVEHLSHGAEVASSIPANSIIFCALRCHNMATTVGMAAVRDGGNCTPIVPYPMIKT